MNMDQVIQSLILAVATALVGAIIAYIRKALQAKAAQISKDQWTLFTWIVSSAVWSTEQAYRAGLIKKDGRLENAVSIVQYEVKASGLKTFDAERITKYCLAALGQELNKDKLLGPNKVPDLPVGPQN